MDSDVSDVESVMSDENNDFIVFTPPNATIIYGRPNSGKSCFIKDLILLQRFNPMPSLVILNIGGEAGAQNIDKKMEEYLEALKYVTMDGGPEYNGENVILVGSIPEGREICSKFQ